MQLLDTFYRDMVHFILIMMSLPGPSACAGIFDNPGCIVIAKLTQSYIYASSASNIARALAS